MSETASIRGGVKFRAPDFLKGWAFDPADPTARLQVEVLLDGRFIAVATADGLREDLIAEGVGDGRHGFRLLLGAALGRGGGKLVVRPVGSSTPLPGGEIQLGAGRDGQVTASGYLESEADQAALAALPIESLAYGARKLNGQRLTARWTNRLRRERNASTAAGAPRVTLIGLGGLQAATRAAWGLQSATNLAVLDLTPEASTALPGEGWVVFAGPSDLPHPSTAHLLAGYTTDAVFWRRFAADAARAGAPGVSIGRPPFDPATARHGALSDTTLAVRAERLAAAPAEVIGALIAGRIHPLVFWLAGQGLAWAQHPEALTSSVGPPPALDRAAFAADLDPLERLLFAEGDALMLAERPATEAFPYVLWPRSRPALTSVIVCFRNDVAATLRGLRSLAGQRTIGDVEVILVDNQSEPAALKAIVAAAEGLFETVRVVAYDAPFNHSAQNNLGAQAARGEVLVFANNDVVLIQEDTLEALSAWAAQPGVGLVGCRLTDPARGRPSRGLAYAPLGDDPFGPVLQESEAAAAWPVRAAAGATLALAAMRRDRFLDLGGLDEAQFPIGYNDVDLSLRASAAGLTHLFLDHVGGEHARGSSRTGDNEDAQIALARGRAAALGRRFEQVGAWRSDRAASAAVADPRRAPAGPLMVFLDLIQDYDVLAPILKALLARGRLPLRIVATDWLQTESPRALAGLEAMGLKVELCPRGKARKGEGPPIGDTAGLLTAAETSAGPHRAAHGLAKRFAEAGRRTFTLQHGLEMIGLTYRDAEYGAEVRFASDTVFTWGSPSDLPDWVAEETRAKCLAAGDLNAAPAAEPRVDVPWPKGRWRQRVGVFENLHWKRYDDAYREAFLEQLGQAAAAAPDTLFLLKPHNAGRWSVAQRERLPQAANLVLADVTDPAWSAYTAGDLMPGLDRVITTPSTVALDAARAGVPVAVFSPGIEASAYAPLPMLRTAEDWAAFVGGANAEAGRAFVERVVTPGDAAALIAVVIEQALRRIG